MAVHLNLLREEQQIEIQRKRDPLKLGMLAVLLIALGMVGFYLLKAAELGGLSRKLAAAESAWNTKQPQFEQAQARQAELSALIAKAEALRGIMTSRFQWAGFLAALTNTVPSNATLTSLSGNIEKERLSCALAGSIAGENPRQLAEQLRGALRLMLEERFDDVSVAFQTLEDETTPLVLEGRQTSGAKFSIELQASLRAAGAPDTEATP